MGKCRELICVYGQSGVGKTTQAEELALLCRKRNPRAIVRLISASGGGWSSIQPAVDEELVEPLFIADRTECYYLMDRLSRGYWPPSTVRFSLPFSLRGALLAPSEQEKWNDVAAIMFDSMTEIATWLMRVTVQREAIGEIKTSAEHAVAIFTDGPLDEVTGKVVVADGIKFASPAKAHYGTIQNAIETYVANTRAFFPDKYVVWSALELKGMDDVSRVPVYGPDIIGKAKTAASGGWFDDLLHLAFVSQKTKTGLLTRRMWLQTHEGEDGIPFMAKARSHRLAPLPPYLEGKEFGLRPFIEQLEGGFDKARAALRAANGI